MWRQSDNSLSQIHHKRTEKERLIAIIERNLKKIGHQENIDDALSQVLRKLSSETGGNYASLNDLNEVALQGLANSTFGYIQDFCHTVKRKTSDIILK
ncbi:MAG: hypothetical protein AB7E37_03870 [Candidatus Altimarinota bacterium]